MPVDGFDLPDFSAPLDLDERLAVIPAGRTVKGFVFTSVTRRLRLPDEHRKKRYVAYRDYPLEDFLRLLARADEQSDGGQILRAAGAKVVSTFHASIVGRVIRSLGADCIEGALGFAQRLYRLGVSFGEVSVERRGPKRWEVQLRDVWAFHPYLFGFIEGLALSYEPTAQVFYRRVSLTGCDLLVEW